MDVHQTAVMALETLEQNNYFGCRISCLAGDLEGVCLLLLHAARPFLTV